MHGNRPYDDFVAQFLAGHAGWQPEPWADLFERAGAKYVVLVTKHHDGVQLWPSDTPNPNKPAWGSDRDVVGDLHEVCDATSPQEISGESEPESWMHVYTPRFRK